MELLSKKLVTGIVVGTVALALIGAGAIAAQIIPKEEIKESQKKIKDKIESNPIVQKGRRYRGRILRR